MPRPRDAQFCCSSMCKREIQPWEKGIAITTFARTLGMGKQRTSKSERIFVCPQCAVRIASEKEPPKTAPVDLAFFHVLLDLAGAEIGDVVLAAGELLQRRRQQILYPPALPEGEIIPPARALKSAS
jgi:hypothetical protein